MRKMASRKTKMGIALEWAGVVVFGCVGAAMFYLFAYLMLL